MGRRKLDNPLTSVIAASFSESEKLRVAMAASRLSMTVSKLVRSAVLKYLDERGL